MLTFKGEGWGGVLRNGGVGGKEKTETREKEFRVCNDIIKDFGVIKRSVGTRALCFPLENLKHVPLFLF